ncbi:hypothetical protein B0H17DRAFT_1147851 [Mycena rosella]|uniref:Uncharacterized protein n=1 Tax=Mycena rosella TaxID=1033263 RepID=A0AAD7FXS3_MYCRO|nr:hypothetical protein B0H17DRAFT_1147851 [Mycena rosella]
MPMFRCAKPPDWVIHGPPVRSEGSRLTLGPTKKEQEPVLHARSAHAAYPGSTRRPSSKNVWIGVPKHIADPSASKTKQNKARASLSLLFFALDLASLALQERDTDAVDCTDTEPCLMITRYAGKFKYLQCLLVSYHGGVRRARLLAPQNIRVAPGAVGDGKGSATGIDCALGCVPTAHQPWYSADQLRYSRTLEFQPSHMPTLTPFILSFLRFGVRPGQA